MSLSVWKELPTHPSSPTFLRAALWGLLGGFLLRGSFPPFDAAVLLPLGLAVSLAAGEGRQPGERSLLGYCTAIAWLSPLPHGLLAWGLSLSALSLLVPASFVAGVFVASGMLANGLPPSLRFLAFPAVWTLLGPAMDLIGAPLCLSAGWADRPAWLAVTPWLGVAGADALIALIASAAARGARAAVQPALPGRALRAALGSAAGAVLALVLPNAVPAPPVADHMWIHAVQPAIPTQRFRAAQQSLYERGAIEHHMDALTTRALARAPGVVALPEGGNSLFNARLPRRHAALEEMMHGTTSELLLASADLTPDGRQLNSVHHVTRAGFGVSVDKAHPVAIAESNLSPGEPGTIGTRWGSLGIAVCYDAIFGGHMRDLARSGAEVLVALSDDASFGTSFLADLHLAYARVRALEVGRSLLFLSNGGPVFAADAQGHTIARRHGTGRAAVISAAMPLVRAPTWAMRGGRHVAFLLLAALVAVSITRGRLRFAYKRRLPRGRRVALVTGHACLAMGAVAAAAGSCELSANAAGRAGSLRAALRDISERASPNLPADHLSTLFRQHGERTCGAAALAYHLTRLGDLVFEEQLVAERAPQDARGYSFAELAELAKLRGFDARGYRGSFEALPRSGEPPAVAHLREGHFVVVLAAEGERISVFDPARGRTGVVPRAEFERAWSGRYLQIATRPIPQWAPGLTVGTGASGSSTGYGEK